MGTSTKRIALRGVAENGAEPPAVTLDALVDTGALFSSAPAEVLRQLGAHALEAFLLTVVPVEQKLVPREAFLM